jgi:hypothetical protein
MASAPAQPGHDSGPAVRDAPASPLPLRVAGAVVAAYDWQPDLPVTLSPRPYLHPVRTLGGTPVTAVRPVDHPHHLGVSVAVSDVAGTNYWGGRTFVPGAGSTWLDNHGSQRHLDFPDRDGGGFTETLEWAPTGRPVALTERRTVRATAFGPADAPTGWALDFAFTLTNRTGAALSIHSSATKGRPGAGYGGFFWRAPHTGTDWRVFTGAAEGEHAVHGSATPWLALGARDPDAGPWTLVLVQRGTPDPWFVRIAEYPGVGPALAWSAPLTVVDTLSRRVVTLIADGEAAPDTVRRWVRELG